MRKHGCFPGVLLLLLAACGGTTSSPSPSVDAGPPTIASACADVAQARCTKTQSCSQLRLANLYGDLATCETDLTLSCTNALGAPGNGNNPGVTEACASEVAGWDCNDFLVGANPPTDCAQQTGSVAMGMPCSAAGQCMTGFCAIGSSPCGVCAAPPTAGQSCTPTYQCGPGLECAAGTCSSPVASGQACGTNIACAPGLSCYSGTCQPLVASVATGQPCGEVGGQLVECQDGTCSFPTGHSPGTCVARSAPGGACSVTTGPACESPGLCVAGTCQLAACM